MSTQATSKMPRNPFAPASTAVNTTSPSQSARPVTLPHIPELYMPMDQTLDALLPRPSSTAASEKFAPAPTKSSHFMDALRSIANRTTTENQAAAYRSTLSPTLDAFASLSQSTDHRDIEKLLTASWTADPSVTLRIIWNLRSIHEGKSAREQFYRAYAWLYQHHPRTAIANLHFLVERTIKRTIKRKGSAAGEEEDAVMVSADPEKDEDTPVPSEVEISMTHGYWKDLLNILLLATHDQLTPTSNLSALHIRMGKANEEESKFGAPAPDATKKTRVNEHATVAELAKVARLEKHRRWHTAVVKKLMQDKSYRALYVTVARLFAEGLARDLVMLQEIADTQTSQTRRIELSFDLTLVGKWAPSIGGSHDRATSIATAIAELLYAGGHLKLQVAPLTQPLSQETAHQLRSAYARWVTAPLRRVLLVPEVAMSAGDWGAIHYGRVPSHCMRAHKKHFLQYDRERFSAYLLAVAQGTASISGATLLPHELLEEGMKLSRSGEIGKVQVQVVEAQWTSLVERVRESGTLPNALAVCDVSGSMGSLGYMQKNRVNPIAPAVALSILLAQVSRPPWAHSFITFSESPELVALDPTAGLVKNAEMMEKTAWGMNTDFNAVFTKLILPAAIENKVQPEDMIQRLFVFSDMQFDDSRRGSGKWTTEHQLIKAAFEKAGYVMPEIVYWNLAGSVALPVTQNEKGVALVSGFSPGMLKVFLEEGSVETENVVAESIGDGEDMAVEKKPLDPIETMMKALEKESYGGLEVHD